MSTKNQLNVNNKFKIEIGRQGSNLKIRAQIFTVFSDLQNYTILSEAAIDKYWSFEI